MSVAETYCLEDTFSDGCKNATLGTLFASLNGSGSKLINTVSFAGVREVDVMKDILPTGRGCILSSARRCWSAGCASEVWHTRSNNGVRTALGGGSRLCFFFLRRRRWRNLRPRAVHLVVRRRHADVVTQ